MAHMLCETFGSDWLEDKIDLPIFDSMCMLPDQHRPALIGTYQNVPPLATPLLQQATSSLPFNVQQAQPSSQYVVPQLEHVSALPTAEDTQALLHEFESVYGAVELNHLTPPHSPPGPATQFLLNLQAPYVQQNIANQHFPAPVQQQISPRTEQWVEILPQQDLSQGLWTSGQDLANETYQIIEHQSKPQSPLSPQSSISVSSPVSPQQSSNSSTSSDEDWSAESTQSARYPHTPRAKPYARLPDDKRNRKKEQNKNAATRYRQKKKAEIEVLLTEESALRQHHNQLDTKCSDLQREIRYLKSLMRDLFKAKGLIK